MWTLIVPLAVMGFLMTTTARLSPCGTGSDRVYETWQGAVDAEVPLTTQARLTILGDGGNYTEHLEIPGFTLSTSLDGSGDYTGSEGFEQGVVLDNDHDDDGTGGEIESIYAAGAAGAGALTVRGFTVADDVVRDNSSAAIEFHFADGVVDDIKFASDMTADKHGIQVYGGNVKVNDVEFTDNANDIKYGISVKRGGYATVVGPLSARSHTCFSPSAGQLFMTPTRFQLHLHF
jgi:hypothetical protein